MTEPTKAELLDTLARVRHEWDQAHSRLLDFDREAEAISACATALDVLKPQTRTGYSYDPVQAKSAGSAIGRVLRYLAERYDVPLVEQHREMVPCDRLHLEDASEGQLVEALKWRRS